MLESVNVCMDGYSWLWLWLDGLVLWLEGRKWLPDMNHEWFCVAECECGDGDRKMKEPDEIEV